jgi:hypothetical protein
MFPDVSDTHPIRKDRTCIDCGLYKRYTEFPYQRHPNSPEKYAALPRCKPCQSAWKNKSHIKRKYGLSWEEYVSMMDKQQGRCLLCGSEGSGKDNKLVVDHDHDTGEVRGLLCWSCNVGMGLFKEDIDLLQKVIKYINRESIE